MNKFKKGDIVQVVKTRRRGGSKEGIVGGYYIGEVFVIKAFAFDNQYFCHCTRGRGNLDRTDYRVDADECVLVSEDI